MLLERVCEKMSEVYFEQNIEFYYHSGMKQMSNKPAAEVVAEGHTSDLRW